MEIRATEYYHSQLMYLVFGFRFKYDCVYSKSVRVCVCVCVCVCACLCACSWVCVCKHSYTHGPALFWLSALVLMKLLADSHKKTPFLWQASPSGEKHRPHAFNLLQNNRKVEDIPNHQEHVFTINLFLESEHFRALKYTCVQGQYCEACFCFHGQPFCPFEINRLNDIPHKKYCSMLLLIVIWKNVTLITNTAQAQRHKPKMNQWTKQDVNQEKGDTMTFSCSFL